MLSHRDLGNAMKLSGCIAVVAALACLLAPLSAHAQATSGLATLYYNYNANPDQANFDSLSALQASLGPAAPAATLITPILNVGDHGNGTQGAAFPSGVGPNTFTGYLSGMIDITTGGSYSFQTGSDDGTVLFIDGQMVVNNNN